MKTKFEDIINNCSSQTFEVNTKLYDLGRQAEIIKKLAEDEIEENGEFAKIYCSNVATWMQQIADLAQKGLDIQFGKE